MGLHALMMCQLIARGGRGGPMVGGFPLPMGMMSGGMVDSDYEDGGRGGGRGGVFTGGMGLAPYAVPFCSPLSQLAAAPVFPQQLLDALGHSSRSRSSGSSSSSSSSTVVLY